MAASIVAIVFLASCVATGLAFCPNGWTRYDNSCYLFSERQDTWFQAKRDCDDLDGRLATVESAKEMHFLTQSLHDRHRMDPSDAIPVYWINGNDMAVDGHWVWENNQTITFFDWGPGMPDNWHGHRQDCLCLYGPFGFKMDDITCGDHYSFVCEISDPTDLGIINIVG